MYDHMHTHNFNCTTVVCDEHVWQLSYNYMLTVDLSITMAKYVGTHSNMMRERDRWREREREKREWGWWKRNVRVGGQVTRTNEKF